MGFRVIVVMVFVMAVFLTEAFAETDWCYEYVERKEYDRAIETCTNDIYSGRYSGTELSKTYLNRGNAYFNKGQYDQAIADYTKAIELDPKSVHAYNNRGYAYFNKGQYDQAIADYTRAIELDPKEASSYFERGMSFSRKEDYDKSIADYTRAIELNPKDARTYDSRSYVYFNKRQYDQAIADYTKVIELRPKDAIAYNNRGYAYINKGQYDQAIADYTRAIELDPKFVLAYYTRGIAYGNKGQYDQAIADYTRAIELNPKIEYQYIRLLNATWLAKGNATGALDRLRQHVATISSNEWVRTISRYYLGIDKMTEQSVLAEARKGKDGKEVNERLCKAYYYIGVKRLVAGKRKEATDYFTKSIKTDVKNCEEYNSSKAMLELMGKKKI